MRQRKRECGHSELRPQFYSLLLDIKRKYKGGRQMGRIKDLNGKKFGSLTVLYFVDTKNAKARWMCRCDCGVEKIITSADLVKGDTKTCGGGIHRRIHGMKETRIYRIWKAMKGRCKYPSTDYYKRYGGRGITYCEEWDVFLNFYEWSKSSGYKDGLTLDRINNDGNYEPSNCRWITQKEQMSNTSQNIFVEIDGVTKTIAGWSEQTGIKHKTLSIRYHKGDRGQRLIRPLEERYSLNARGIKTNQRN